MRILVLFWCIAAFGQYTPSSILGLSTSTARLDPLATPPEPLPGAKYVDTYHPNGTGFVEIQKLPDIPSNCTIRTWATNFNVGPSGPILYLGHYYHVPYSAGVMTSPQFSKLTTAAAAAGTNVLTFTSTAQTSTFLNGLRTGLAFTVAGTNIPVGTTVASFTATTVTLSANITGAGVASGASVSFTTYPTQVPFVEITQAEACAMVKTVVSYGSRQAFNKDNSRFIVFPRGLLNTIALYRTNPLQFEKFIVNAEIASTNGSEVWDKDDPDIIYYFGNPGATFKKLNVVTEVVTTVYSFKFDGTDCPSGLANPYVNNGASGNPSADQRYWPAVCKYNGGADDIRLIVYDKVLNQVTSKKDISVICGGAGHETDIVTMSPSGNYFIASWLQSPKEESVWSTCKGAELFDRGTLTSRGMVFSYGSGHLDTGYDVRGVEIAFSTLNGHVRVPGETGTGLYAPFTPLDEVHPPPYNIATSYVRRLRVPCTLQYVQTGSNPYTDCDFSVVGGFPGFPTMHTSGRGAQDPTKGGWYLLSNVSEQGPPGIEAPGWGLSENLAMMADSAVTAPESTAVFRRVSRNLSTRQNTPPHPQCTSGTDYFQEAHTTVNADWTKLIFTSNWLVQCGGTKVYIVDLPTQAQQITTLTMKVTRKGDGAIVTFGKRELPMDTSCTVQALNGTTPVATLASTSGLAMRWVGFNSLPSSELTFKATCGTELGLATGAPSTALTGTGSLRVTAMGMTSITGDFGTVAAVGDVATVTDLPLGVVVAFQVVRGSQVGDVQYAFPAASTLTSIYTAASCSRADVNTALSQHLSSPADGDIINIPAGNCTWTTGITATITRNLTIQGAGAISATDGGAGTTGSDLTSILDHHPTPYHRLLEFTVSTGKTLRITGIAFKGDSSSTVVQAVLNINGGANAIRFDHCHVALNADDSMMIATYSNRLTGVIDHNYFDADLGQGPHGIYLQPEMGDDIWAEPDDWGTNKFLFLEDNRWRNGYFGDSNGGGVRIVFRHNTAVHQGSEGYAMGYFPNHGITSGRNRSSRAWEYYGNTISVPAPGKNGSPFPLNGGTALAWGNTISQYRYVIDVNYTRKNNSTYPYGSPPTGWGNCTGSAGTVWDGSGGYPCLDQPGRGQGDLLSGSTIATTVNTRTGNAAHVIQALSPLYIWGNTLDPAGYSDSFIVHEAADSEMFQANRDYYQQFGTGGETGSFNGTAGVGQGLLAARPSTCTAGPGGNTPGVGYWGTDTSTLYVCTATNTWTTYYQPYTYPHPLNN